MADFRPGFLNTGRGAGGAGAPPRDRRNFLQRFWQEQIMSPDKVDGNVSIAWAVVVFAGGVIVTRTLAKDMIVPAF